MTVQLYALGPVSQDTASLERPRQVLYDLMHDTELTIYPKSRGADGVIRAWVFKQRTCINREMLARGYAAWNQQEAPTEDKLMVLQLVAQ